MNSLPSPGEIWVIDTSSIITVWRNLPTPKRVDAYAAMEGFAHAGQIVFPVEVVKELERGALKKPKADDPPLEWAKRVESVAVSNPAWESVRRVLGKVPSVLDSEKTGGAEEADPYVLAGAVELKEAGRQVVIITEEKADPPGKLSLSSAAGILKVPAVRIIPLLQSWGLA